MWCRSVLRPSFPRTPIELQQCFATPAALCRRRGRRGVSGRVSLDIAGRTVPAARVADTPRPGRCQLADDADAPRAGSRSQRRRGPCSIGPGSPRCVIGWRARPETFAACGFSDLRAGFVLRDESGRRQRSRAPHESGRAAPEHGAGSPALGTRPQPLGVLRSTNWARITEESDARTRGASGTRGRASRVAISAPTSTSSSSVPIVATTWRSPSGRFLTWARCGSRRPTTRSRGPATSRGSRARPRQKQTGRRQRRNKPRPLALDTQHLVHHRRQPDRTDTPRG